MTRMVQCIVVMAAVLFVSGSASMNAAFLASFGRTPVEIGVLVAVSVAADAVKVVLPVLVLRAVAMRLWGQACGAGLLLAVVTAMSLVSGVGFASLTRGHVTAAREHSKSLRQVQATDLAGIEKRIAALPAARLLPHIDNDVAAMMLDPLWRTSKGCTQASPVAAGALRAFCGNVFRLRNERETAVEHTALSTERQTLRAEMSRLGPPAIAGDVQAVALAEMMGIEPHLPRLVLTAATAIMLELGAMILVVLAAGPTVNGWSDPRHAPQPPQNPAELPASVDRLHWQRRQARTLTDGKLTR